MVRHSITLLTALSALHTVLPVAADLLNHAHLPNHHRGHHRHHAHVQRDMALPAGWSYIGCRGDPSGGRMIPVKLTTSTVSPGLCTTACNSAGYTAAGMQYGSECWCGYIDQLNNPTTLSESSCSMTCSGECLTVPDLPTSALRSPLQITTTPLGCLQLSAPPSPDRRFSCLPFLSNSA